MTITLGRIGVPAAEGGDGTVVDDPHAIERQGRTLTLTGLHTATAQSQLVWWARQLLGLVDGEEPVVPVTCSSEGNLDGYYRVLDAQVAHEQGSTRGDGYLRWQVQLEQAGDFRQPRIELPAAYGLLTNGRSITSYTSIQAFPGDAVVVLAAFDPDQNGSRSVGDGSGNAVIYLGDATNAAATSGVGAFVCPPANYYVGGCRVEHDLGSSTWRHAVGRPSFPSVGVTGSDSGRLRLSNGLVRATLTYSNATVSTWSVEWWDGAQWDAATEFNVVGFGQHGELALHSASILANTAERCTLRFRALGANIGIEGLTHCDFTIRRGVRWLWVHPSGDYAPTGGWRIQFDASIPSTAITGGLHRTTNNAGGNRELLASASNASADLANGRLTAPTATTSELFGVGCEVGGSGAAGRNTAASQMEEFFAAFTETARVVAN